MDYNNYLSLEKLSIRYKFFCFIDTKEYLADVLFVKNQVKVHFQKEAHKSDTEYVVIICKVKKRDINMFKKSLEELKQKMVLMGHLDYECFCKDFYQSIEEMSA